MNPEPELIPQGDSWLVRETVESGKVKDNIVQNRKFKHELVYGTWEEARNKDGLVTGHKIIGEVFHTLTGPNGKKALEEMSDRFNQEGKKPDAAEGMPGFLKRGGASDAVAAARLLAEQQKKK